MGSPEAEESCEVVLQHEAGRRDLSVIEVKVFSRFGGLGFRV